MTQASDHTRETALLRRDFFFLCVAVADMQNMAAGFFPSCRKSSAMILDPGLPSQCLPPGLLQNQQTATHTPRETCPAFFQDVESFVREVALGFMPSFLPLAERRGREPFSEKQRQWQLMRRGRYLEFNLLYDRGQFRNRRSSELVLINALVWD